ncbi:hypothetical protein AeRB84_011415 [Aphanomyces euteiches]|nr:hypothetical protein AeRB84_011415 [Aphanomyces euteiches]
MGLFLREPRKLVMKWMDMRITRLTVMNGWKFPSEWIKELPRFQYLTSLRTGSLDIPIQDVYEVATMHEKLAELYIDAGGSPMNSSTLEYAIEWFRSGRARVFLSASGHWDRDDDMKVQQTFFEAMFNCPTFALLELRRCRFDNVDFTPLTFAMATLDLYQCTIDLKGIASRFSVSRMTTLKFHSDVQLPTLDYVCLSVASVATNINQTFEAVESNDSQQ